MTTSSLSRPGDREPAGRSPRVRGVTPPLSVAPMMDRTDRHFRAFLRRITRRTLLYTEMVPVWAVIHGDGERALAYSPEERPLALQLGGDDPVMLAECARRAEGLGFDEINLNVGCPSGRVQEGNFGVCLMGKPEQVAEAVAAMRRAVDVPVTVKHRIGFDDLDRYEDMLRFVDRVAAAGCDRFTVHARKAWLRGLNPKQNRNVPPLRYEEVYRLKEERPELPIEINGGIRSLDEVRGHLAHGVDGVMIGRAAYDDPFLLARADREFFGAEGTSDHGPDGVPTRREVIEAMIPYVERRLAAGDSLQHLTRHLLGLFAGRPGARAWRRYLTEAARRPEASADLLEEAAALVPEEVLDERPGRSGEGDASDGAGSARRGDGRSRQVGAA